MAGQVGHPQSTRHRVQVFQEPGPVRQVPVLMRLLCAHAGEEEVLEAAGIVGQGDGAVAGAGERPGRVHDPLEHRVEVQALVDAETGLAEESQALLQSLYP